MKTIKFILLFTVLILSVVSCSNDDNIQYASDQVIKGKAKNTVIEKVSMQTGAVWCSITDARIIKEIPNYYVYELSVTVEYQFNNKPNTYVYVTCYVSIDGIEASVHTLNEELFINYKK